MQEGLSRLLVEVCVDAQRLEEVRADLPGALQAAGVAPALVELVERRRGAWISHALNLTRPLPTAEAITEYVRERAAEDPAFAEQVRLEPKPVLERVFQTRFPPQSSLEVAEVDGSFEVRVMDLPSAPVGDPGVFEATMGGDTVVDVDVDVDIDIDIDAIVVVDVDVDVDIDIVQQEQPSGAWSQTWARRRARWRAADDRLEPVG